MTSKPTEAGAVRRRRCIAERVDDDAVIWHVVPPKARPDDTWCPILCSSEWGITFPSLPETREPTCPECRRLVTR